MSIVRLIFKQKEILNIPIFKNARKNAIFRTTVSIVYILWYFTQSQLETSMELMFQKWDFYHAEALNSILPKQSITQTYS